MLFYCLLTFGKLQVMISRRLRIMSPKMITPALAEYVIKQLEEHYQGSAPCEQLIPGKAAWGNLSKS
jgi:hypothetical protein